MGYTGKILKVDLSTKKVEIEKENPTDLLNFIGGKGLALKLLSDDLKSAEPFSSENEIIFSTGPFVGDQNIPSGGRFSTATFGVNGEKSVSSTGGLFGVALKLVGYDALVIRGKAQNNSYVLVESDRVEIKNASEFLGLRTSECDDFYNAKSSVACIGPAGEKLVPFASIVFDKHILASKNGIGAVMGWKNLKAIILNPNRKIDDPCATCPIKCGKYNFYTNEPHWKEAGRTFIENCSLTQQEVKTLVNLCDDLGIDSVNAGKVTKCNLGSRASFVKDVKVFLEEIAYGKRQFESCLESKKHDDDPIKTILDSFGMCAFAYKNSKIEDLLNTINAAMNWKLTKADLIKMADEINRLTLKVKT